MALANAVVETGGTSDMTRRPYRHDGATLRLTVLAALFAILPHFCPMVPAGEFGGVLRVFLVCASDAALLRIRGDLHGLLGLFVSSVSCRLGESQSRL